MADQTMTEAPHSEVDRRQQICYTNPKQIPSHFEVELQKRYMEHESRLSNIEEVLKQVIPLTSENENDASSFTRFKVARVKNKLRLANNDGSNGVQYQMLPAQQKIDELENACDNLKAANKDLLLVQKTAFSYIDKLKQELASSQVQQSALQDQVRQLNEAIIKTRPSDNEPPDNELIAAFCEIVSFIQKVCNTLATNDYHINFNRCTGKQVRNFLNAIPTHQALELRLRARFFRVLRSGIFDVPFFGLPDPSETAFATLEEAIMRGKHRELDSIVEWRKQSILCAQKLGPPLDGRNQVTRIRRILSTYVEPFSHIDHDAKKRTCQDLEILCEKAWKLALRMRTSIHFHQVRDIERGRLLTSPEESDLTVVGSEEEDVNEDDIAGSPVSCTLSGALVRHDFTSGRVIVLEKAQVLFSRGKSEDQPMHQK